MKVPPEEICKLFKAFLSVEDKMLKGLEEHSATCGVPPEVLKQVKAGHSKASQMSKQIRSEEYTSELQSPDHLVCRLLLEKKKKNQSQHNYNATQKKK